MYPSINLQVVSVLSTVTVLSPFKNHLLVGLSGARALLPSVHGRPPRACSSSVLPVGRVVWTYCCLGLVTLPRGLVVSAVSLHSLEASSSGGSPSWCPAAGAGEDGSRRKNPRPSGAYPSSRPPRLSRAHRPGLRGVYVPAPLDAVPVPMLVCFKNPRRVKSVTTTQIF